jgi:hypothetical protein
VIHLRELIEFCKAEALAAKLAPSEVSNWRYFCREYSKTFFTPLHEVMKLSPELVIASVFEDQLSKKDLDNQDDYDAILEEFHRVEDPNYDANAEKEMDDFVAGIEAWEEERQRTGGAIPRPKKKKLVDQQASKPKPPPEKDPVELKPIEGLRKHGFVDFSKFKQDEES